LPRTVFVDGYNMILSGAGGRFKGSSLEESRGKLIRFLNSALAGKTRRVIVVFDGDPDSPLPRTQRQGIVEVRFSRKPAGADELIVRLAAKASDALVVTGDRELASRVKSEGARTASPERFLQDLARKRARRHPRDEKPPAPGRKEVSFWEKLFFQPRDGDEEE